MHKVLVPALISGLLSVSSPANAVDPITDAAVLADLVQIIQSNGHYCPRIIGAWMMGLDGAYGPTFNVVCPGDTATGTRYKVSAPSRGVYKVRVGW